MIHALIFAGGVGTRMHTNALPKQFLMVHGKPVIVYTIQAFEKLDAVDDICVVCTPDWVEHMNSLVDEFLLGKVSLVVPGGSTALESQRIGLEALDSCGASGEDVVLIHDGVRPLIDGETIRSCIDSVEIYGSAVTVAPAIETIATLDADGNISSTVRRSDCVLARAPQAFHLGEMLAVHRRAQADGLTFVDSATMMTHYGHKAHAVEGKPENIKVTTPSDYFTMRALLDARECEQIGGL